jgi:hypothetical protein
MPWNKKDALLPHEATSWNRAALAADSAFFRTRLSTSRSCPAIVSTIRAIRHRLPQHPITTKARHGRRVKHGNRKRAGKHGTGRRLFIQCLGRQSTRAETGLIGSPKPPPPTAAAATLGSAFLKAACCRFRWGCVRRGNRRFVRPQGKPRWRKRRQAVRTPKWANPGPGRDKCGVSFMAKNSKQVAYQSTADQPYRFKVSFPKRVPCRWRGPVHNH